MDNIGYTVVIGVRGDNYDLWVPGGPTWYTEYEIPS